MGIINKKQKNVAALDGFKLFITIFFKKYKTIVEAVKNNTTKSGISRIPLKTF